MQNDGQYGKTLAMLREIEFHITGAYPQWWQGKRLTRPVRIWIVGPKEVCNDK
jgi:hypothetical protein